MSNWDDVAKRQKDLIRRFRDGVVLIAPYSAPVVESLDNGVTPDIVVPEGYVPLGWFTEEGYSVTSEVEASEIRSAGSARPTRKDIISRSSSLTVVAQETNVRTIALNAGVDMGLLVTTSTGQLVVDVPDVPDSRAYRLLAITKDQSRSGADIYVAVHYSSAKLTNQSSPSYAPGDTALQYSLTFEGEPDDEAGFAERHLFSGPGWAEYLEKMGLTLGGAPAPAGGGGTPPAGGEGGGDGGIVGG